MQFKPIVPKNLDGPLKVLVLARSVARSEPHTQRHALLDASWARAADYIRSIYDWPLKICRLFERNSIAGAKSSVFRQLLTLIAIGDLDLVVAEDLTRITRDTSELCEFMDACIKAGVRVVTVDQEFDSEGFYGSSGRFRD